jgi:spermidine/putrescine-binding protein
MKEAFVVFLVLVLCTGVIFSNPQKEQNQIPFGQGVEDEVVVCCDTGNGLAWAESVQEEFKAYIKAKYGKDIKVILNPGSTTAYWAKFTTEWPNPTFDVMLTYPNWLLEGIDKGYWEKVVDYLSPETKNGLNQSLLSKYSGYGVPYDLHYYGPVVRKDLIPFEFTSNTDILNSRLYERFIFDSAVKVGSGWLAVLAAAVVASEDWRTWRNPDGTFNAKNAEPSFRLLRKWYENALTLSEGSGTIRPLLERGEIFLSFWWSSQAILEQQNGYSGIDYIFVKEGTISWGETNLVVPTHAPHRNLGIEWINYIMSKQGYEVAYAKGKVVGYLLPRTDLVPPGVEQKYQPPVGSVVHSGNDFRLFIESEKVIRDATDLYTRVVIEGR